MKSSYRSRLVGVFGSPVDENPSVVMNEAAFAAAGLDWRYITMLVEPQDLAAAFAGLRAMNFEGVNLTIPHKVEGMKYVDEISPGAKLIGAINHVVRKGDRLVGDNTDGKGFVESLRHAGMELTGKSIVVLGAGGASRAICVECALAGCTEIQILGRTASKAGEIADIVNNNACIARALPWEGTARIPACDILINATSVGLAPDPNCPDIRYEDIVPGMFVQDVIPNPLDTLFLQKARQRGAKTGSGLSMLVQQGAIGFTLWTGQKAPLEAMQRAMEQENASQ